MRINVRHIENRSRILELHILGIPGRETDQTEMKNNKKIFLKQTSSSIQITKVHIIFMGKDNENTKENRNLQGLTEFMEINDKEKLLKQMGKSKSD